MSLDVFVRFELKPGRNAEFLEEAMRVVPPSRAEPGCISINLYESLREPHTYFIHSEWRDEQAFNLHAEMPHTKYFLGQLEQLMANPFEAVRTKEIATE